MADADRAGVLLDIDGTLLDSTYHHGLAWLRAFQRNGHPEVTAAQAHRAIGLGDDQLVPHLIGSSDSALAEAHSTEYEKLKGEVRALPGAADLLARCAQANLRVALATSGKAKDLDWMLPRIGGAEHVEATITSEDVEDTKPEPDLLQTAVDTLGLAAERAVTIGDSVWDGEAAARAGVRFIGVLSGGFAESELREAGAVEVYRDAADLVEHFDQSLLSSL
ncbi:HAD family hydrolase [Rhodococcus sp. X156]|uniref:HAD family hydrolase n=1 Tax=Rhodococcus sp. X156 TaxID=2499145 RepID=UPI000FD8DFC5|nr:HAD family hydrolase [Rhodococcus sp. X156]